MVQMAYRTKYCGWTLEQATDEIARTFGLVEVSHGPDYRHMESFYTRARPALPPAGRPAAAAAAAAARDGRDRSERGADSLAAIDPAPRP